MSQDFLYCSDGYIIDVHDRCTGMPHGVVALAKRLMVLKSGDTEKRSGKIEGWVNEGLDVLICNPKLVETGNDLLGTYNLREVIFCERKVSKCFRTNALSNCKMVTPTVQYFKFLDKSPFSEYLDEHYLAPLSIS